MNKLPIQLHCDFCDLDFKLDNDSYFSVDIEYSSSGGTIDALSIETRCPKCDRYVYGSIGLKELLLKILE